MPFLKFDMKVSWFNISWFNNKYISKFLNFIQVKKIRYILFNKYIY